MKIKLHILALTLALCAVACTSDRQGQNSQQTQKDEEISRQLSETLKAHEEWKKQHADKLNRSFASVPRDSQPDKSYVRVGMTNEEVRKLCGPPDHTDSMTTEQHYAVSYEYDIDRDKDNNGCWGRLYFDNSKLVSIYR